MSSKVSAIGNGAFLGMDEQLPAHGKQQIKLLTQLLLYLLNCVYLNPQFFSLLPFLFSSLSRLCGACWWLKYKKVSSVNYIHLDQALKSSNNNLRRSLQRKIKIRTIISAHVSLSLANYPKIIFVTV